MLNLSTIENLPWQREQIRKKYMELPKFPNLVFNSTPLGLKQSNWKEIKLIMLSQGTSFR